MDEPERVGSNRALQADDRTSPAVTAPGAEARPADDRATRVGEINARIDRLPGWGLSPWVLGALAFSYLVVYFDVGAMGVVLPEVLADLHLPEGASSAPLSWNLIAYVIGAYAFGSLADYAGRRRAFVVSIVVLAVSALLTAFSWDLTSVTVFRFLTGLGTGGQIAVLSTFIGELSNAGSRGRFLSLCVAGGAVGIAAAPFLGLVLLPVGRSGWRVLFGVGVLIAIVLCSCRDRWLPESPRWLVLRGDHVRAERIVTGMEAVAFRGPVPPLPQAERAPAERTSHGFPTLQLFSRTLLPRLVLIVAFWFMFELWMYGFLGYQPTLLAKLDISPGDSLLYSGIGYLGFVAGALVAPLVIDRIERKILVAASIAVAIVGFVLFAVSSSPLMIIVSGLVVGLGVMCGNAAGYAYTAETFPTRVRASATSLGDGLGHVGGAVAPFVVLAVLETRQPQSVYWVLAGIAVASLLIILAGVRTSRAGLTEISQ